MIKLVSVYARGTEIYINPNQIACFYKRARETGTFIRLSTKTELCVVETPEEILELIGGTH